MRSLIRLNWSLIGDRDFFGEFVLVKRALGCRLGRPVSKIEHRHKQLNIKYIHQRGLALYKNVCIIINMKLCTNQASLNTRTEKLYKPCLTKHQD